jgi:hypothetical protein
VTRQIWIARMHGSDNAAVPILPQEGAARVNFVFGNRDTTNRLSSSDLIV